MKKKEKLNRFLSKKEIAELKEAERKLLELQQMLERAKAEFENEHKKERNEDLPIIFK